MSVAQQRVTLFRTLADENVAHVLRYLSKQPRHPLWHRYIEMETLMLMFDADEVLARVAGDTFDAISTHRKLPPRIIEEDNYTRVLVSAGYCWNNLDKYAPRLRVRSLTLTPDCIHHLLRAQSLTAEFAKSVNDLSLVSFGATHKDVVRQLLQLMGPNLTSLQAVAVVPGLLEAIQKHCQILVKLSIQHIDGAVAGLSKVGDWRYDGDWRILCETLRVLSLSYVNDCPPEDAELVRTSFRGLRELSVTFWSEVPLACYRTAVKFFGGVWKHNLERADVGDMPPALVSRIRSFYPSTRLTVRLGGLDTIGQMRACGDSLACAKFEAWDHGLFLEFDGEALAEAARKCGRIEEIRLMSHWGQMALGNNIVEAPLGRLQRVHFEQMHPSALEQLANRAGELRDLYYSGDEPSVDTMKLLAQNNPRLRRVHIVVWNWTAAGVIGFVVALANCKDLVELVVNAPNAASNDSVRVLHAALQTTPELGRYHIRRTFVRVLGMVFQE